MYTVYVHALPTLCLASSGSCAMLSFLGSAHSALFVTCGFIYRETNHKYL
jgi:hypothetical protein